MFSDTTNCPKIVDETQTQTDRITIFWGTASYWKRTITTSSYRFTWLTQAAADSIAAAKNADTSDTVSRISTKASSVRMHDIGAFAVRVTQTTTPKAWSADT